MKKWIPTLTLNLIFCILGFGQPPESLSKNFIDLLQNQDVFFNRKLINPTNLTDSNNYLIDLVIHDEWLGTSSPKNGLLLSGETILPLIKSSIGINIDFRNLGYFQHSSFTASYKYNLKINTESSINLGLNLGVWHYTYNYSDVRLLVNLPIVSDETQKINSPLLDIGISYKNRKHDLRISYNNIINSKMELGDSDIFIRKKGLIANYQYVFNLNKNLSFSPEIFACFDSKDKYGILSCKLNIYKIFSSGLLYNTKDSIGIFFSSLIKDKFKVEYFFERESAFSTNYGVHALKLGVIL